MQRLALNDSGSIAPLVAGYLALVVMVSLMAANVTTAMALAHRVQGVADAAIIYAHERSLRVGLPVEGALKQQLAIFLESAPSAKRLTVVSSRVETRGAKSTLVLCSRFQLPLSSDPVVICKQASAESYLVPTA